MADKIQCELNAYGENNSNEIYTVMALSNVLILRKGILKSWIDSSLKMSINIHL